MWPRLRLLVIFALVNVACAGAPWAAPGVPSRPPDEQFGTGAEAGEDVYIWHCHEGERVMVSQWGSACYGTRAPVVERGACGKPLPGERRFESEFPKDGARGRPSQSWPGTDAGI
jgi:hypothetical protein